MAIPIVFFSLPAFAEDVTISTYYPSPYGNYKNLETTDNTSLATTGGSVGIGTTSPAAGAKLDVRGNLHIHMAPSDAGLQFGDNNPVDNKWHIGYWEPSIAPPSGALVFTETGVADGILTLKAGGGVGIGTLTPAAGAKLDVNGNVNVAGTIKIVGGTPGAGKVLTSDASGNATWQYPTYS